MSKMRAMKLGVAWLLLFGGCGTPSPIDVACNHGAQVFCAKLRDCTEGFLLSYEYGTLDNCLRRAPFTCHADILESAGTNTTAADQEGCVAAVDAESCDDFLNDVAPLACQPPPGKLPDGAVCASGAQCQSSHCSSGNPTLCGVCAPFSRAGDPCGPGAASCSGDFHCSQAGVCVPLGQVDAPCDADTPCAYGLVCGGSPTTMSGTCRVPSATSGAPCDPTPFSGSTCDFRRGLVCGGSHTCVPVYLAPLGAVCGNLPSGPVPCSDGTCVLSSVGASTGTCVAFLADGAPCDTKVGARCAPPSGCVVSFPGETTGICRTFDPRDCH